MIIGSSMVMVNRGGSLIGNWMNDNRFEVYGQKRVA
jgi:hypothetical protein